MRKTTVIMCILTLCVVLPARAEIASKAYVDQRDNKLIFGNETPDAEYVQQLEEMGGVIGGVTNMMEGFNEAMAEKMDDMDIDSTPTSGSSNLVTSGGVADAIAVEHDMTTRIGNVASNAVSSQQPAGAAGGILSVGTTGKVEIKSGGYVTNNEVSSSANIELGKLAFPSPPEACDTRGCMLMYYNGKYVWEPVTRDSGETVVTTGSINATPTATTVTTTEVHSATPCSITGQTWNQSTGQCEGDVMR